jgi:hypothetical protein
MPETFGTVFMFARSREKGALAVYIYPKDVDKLTFGAAVSLLDGAVGSEHEAQRLRPRLRAV